MPNVTIRQLEVFLEAAETLSFVRAAERFRLTPSAVSFQVRQVELQTGYPLFERIGRRVALTEAGRVLLEYARPVLRSMRDLDQAMLALHGAESGHVRLGLVSTAKYIVPHMVARFRTRLPGVTVHLQEGNRRETLASLLAGDIDLAIMGQPPDTAAVAAERFATHPSVVIAAPSHPLSGAGRLAATALAGEWIIIREEGSGTRALSDRFFQAAGYTPRVAMETSSNEMIKQAVMAGMGLAVLSQHTIGLEQSLKLLEVLDVEGFPIMRSWFVAQRRNVPLLPTHASLRDYVLEMGSVIVDEIARGVGASGLRPEDPPQAAPEGEVDD